MLETISALIKNNRFFACLILFYFLTIAFTGGESKLAWKLILNLNSIKRFYLFYVQFKCPQLNAINARSQIRDVAIRFKMIRPFLSRVRLMQPNVANTNGKVSVKWLIFFWDKHLNQIKIWSWRWSNLFWARMRNSRRSESQRGPQLHYKSW